MLTISFKQMQQLDQVVFNKYMKEMHNELRDLGLFSGKYTEEEELKFITEQSNKCIKKLNIEQCNSLFDFMLLSFQHPYKMRYENWDSEISEILTWPDRSEGRKINLLRRYLENVQVL